MTNTDTFFSWVPVRRSVTGILNFVAHFQYFLHTFDIESVLQCSNFLHCYMSTDMPIFVLDLEQFLVLN